LAHINPEEAALLKSRGGSGTINPNTGLPEYKKFWKQASISNIVGAVENPIQAIQDVVVEPVQQVASNLSNLPGSIQNTFDQASSLPLAQIAIAYYMPGLVSSFAPSLGALGITSAAAQTAVASAMASTALQVAQGVPLNQALQEAMVNSVISTGSTETAINLNKLFENPAITNAVVSAGSSAAKTALNGGSQSDVERNLIAGLVGSGAATATGSNIAGSAAGGAVTGGVTGALLGAASARGAQVAAENNPTQQTSGASADPGVQVAGGDDATALKMASISAMPQMLGKSGETASAITPVVEGGQTFYERTITGKTPDGKEYSYTVTYDPGAASGKQVSYTTSGVVKDAEGNVIPTGGGGATASFTRPDFTAKDTGVYTPSIITTGQPFSPPTRPTTNTTPSDTSILDTISTAQGGGQTTGITDGGGAGTTSTAVGTGDGAGVNTGTGTGTGTGFTGTGTGGGGTGTGTGGGGDGTGTGTGTGGEGDGTGTGGGGGGEYAGPGGGKELPPVEDKTGKPVPYTPKIFTYGGVESTLPTSLKTKTPFYPVAATTAGLTSSRGAGEIESKETGKPRKNVWNEASLRLKDALGV